ncbi:MAG: hypothetical protein U0X39_06955 [Bacteroidales bacterium]
MVLFIKDRLIILSSDCISINQENQILLPGIAPGLLLIMRNLTRGRRPCLEKNTLNKLLDVKARSIDYIRPVFSHKHKITHNSVLQQARGGQFTLAGSGQRYRPFQLSKIRIKSRM